MKKLMLLSLENGNFSDGFEVAIKILENKENKPDNVAQLYCQLTPAPQLSEYYRTFLTNYDNIRKDQLWSTRGFKKDQITNVDISKYVEQCNQSLSDLQTSLNDWLNPIKEKLKSILTRDLQEDIKVVIQTHKISCKSTKDILHKLPWHLWDLFDDDYFSEVVFSFVDSEQIYSNSAQKSTSEKLRRVKILSVLGDDSDGINVEADRRLIRKIPGAYAVFLRQPKKEALEQILTERWDIFVFSGHSKTQGKTGFLTINSEEEVNIQDIKKAIKSGMKLAIFNSCDGLGLAYQLSSLDIDIAQIIVWREPVPNLVAQEFLKYFLDFYASGLSLHLSVQKARFKVQQYIENNKTLQIPELSWLPVIHQNLTKEDITWQELRGYTDIGINSNNELRQELLKKVENYWVKGVLEKSLHSRKEDLEDLEVLRQQEMIQLSLNGDFEELEFPFPSGTRPIDKFDELVGKRTMLILGKPGSGKTIALLEIASELIIDAKQDSGLPIPVVLNLSSWDLEYLRSDQRTARQNSWGINQRFLRRFINRASHEPTTTPLVKWIITELNRLYQIPKSQGYELINQQKLLLLLDGLDEVEEGHKRNSCVRAINQFLGEFEETEMVVSCRLEDYEALDERLYFQDKIYINTIEQAQINRYFSDMGESLKAVYELLSRPEETDPLQQLVDTPLIVNLVTSAYKDMSKEDLLEITSLEERRQHLLDLYIDRALTLKSLPKL